MSEKAKWSKQKTNILGGKAQILQTVASNGVWQFRCFISEEKKYVRKSLRTKDKETAIIRAEEEYFKIRTDLTAGRKIFGLKLSELIDAYLQYRAKHVEVGAITAGRLGTIKSQMNHLLDYKGKNIKLSELDRKSLFDYLYFRRQEGANDVTIRNEHSTFNAMAKWGYENGLCDIPKFEFDIIRIKEVGRRDTFTLEEYNEFTTAMRDWTNSRKIKDPEIKAERLLIRDFILVLSNTFMRIGEARQLRWKDIFTTDYQKDKGKTQLVHLRVRPEISKTRKQREIITRGGRYFDRIKKRSRFTDSEDFVFTEIDSSKQFSKTKLYDYWRELMDIIDMPYRDRNITYYSLRHFGITMRLGAGVSIWDVAKIAGTGVEYIEKHYGHASHEMMANAAMKEYNDGVNEDLGLLIQK